VEVANAGIFLETPIVMMLLLEAEAAAVEAFAPLTLGLLL
jgi:hypothetical protein